MIWIGTSGYNYPEWRGTFYPEKLPAARMLPYYAGEFRTVEINYTFYHLPSERTLVSWAAETPDDFRFTLKAPKRITHVARLRGCGPLVSTFCELAGALGPKLGVLLFQLPPFLKKDLSLLDGFLAMLPPHARAAIEFRHASWFDEETFASLRARGAALCVADSERLRTPVVTTARFGYFRLRDEGYDAVALQSWAAAIQAEAGRTEETFVYFKHEEAGKGPQFARMLRAELDAAAPAGK